MSDFEIEKNGETAENAEEIAQTAAPAEEPSEEVVAAAEEAPAAPTEE